MNKLNIQVLVNNELYYVENVSDRNHFSYIDSFNCVNYVDINDKEILIKRIDKDHSTLLAIKDESYLEINSEEGTLNFDIKGVAINRNFDIISIVYTINDEEKKIEIRYLGDK